MSKNEIPGIANELAACRPRFRAQPANSENALIDSAKKLLAEIVYFSELESRVRRKALTSTDGSE